MIGPKDDPMATGGALGPDARALLDAARAGLSPDAAAVRRVHAGVHGAVAGAATGTALAAKLGIFAIVAMVAAGAALYARRGAAPGAPARTQLRAAESPAAPAALPSDAVDPDLITIETAPSSAPAGPAAVAPAPADPAPHHRAPVAAPARPAAMVASVAPAPPAAVGTASRSAPGGSSSAAPRGTPRLPSRAAPSPGIELGREVELVDRAMAALRRGDPGEALRVVRVYAAEAGGHGQLTQDADAIAVEALCRLGDPGAGERLAQFAVQFPRSAQRARLAAACK